MLFNDRLRKVLTPMLAVISGIMLFTAVAAASLDTSLFNSCFHLELINKYGIYRQLEKAVDNSLKNYLKDMKSDPLEEQKQKEQLLSLVNKAVTPDMVKLNTDTLVEGLMKYFSGEASFLPDIYLKPVNGKQVIESSDTTLRDSAAPEESLAGIDRVSLDVILMYMDRNDLINTFSEIRLARFTLSYVPIFLLLFSLLLLVISAAYSKVSEIKARLSQTLLWAGIFSAAAGVLMLGSSMFYLPKYLALSPITKYIEFDTLYGYMKAWIQRPALTIAICGAVMLAMIFTIKLLPNAKKPFNPEAAGFFIKHGKLLISILLVLLLSGTLLIKAEAMKGDFHSKDLGAALERLKGGNAHATVIAARDQNIYSVEVRMVDKQTGEPVQGLQMFLGGRLTDNKKNYSESGTSDNFGKAKFNILKGEFKLEFDRLQFPENYNIPAPYPFEVKAAGTTIITVNLEKTEAKKPGIAEVLIMGAENKPLESLELVAEAEDSTASGKVYSFTNKDGVAVFKLPEGYYTISFLESELTRNYILPESIPIEVISDSNSQYSLKLSSKAPIPKPKKSKK